MENILGSIQLSEPNQEANVLKFDHDMVTDEVNITKAEEVNTVLNELAASTAFEAPAMMIDFSAVQKSIENGITPDTLMLKPLSEVPVACACDTCLEENADVLRADDSTERNCFSEQADTVALTFDMVMALTTRVKDLEQRIEAHNLRSGHKI